MHFYVLLNETIFQKPSYPWSGRHLINVRLVGDEWLVWWLKWCVWMVHEQLRCWSLILLVWVGRRKLIISCLVMKWLVILVVILLLIYIIESFHWTAAKATSTKGPIPFIMMHPAARGLHGGTFTNLKTSLTLPNVFVYHIISFLIWHSLFTSSWYFKVL